MASPLALLHYGEAQELGIRSALGANMIVRRTVLDALGGFDPHFGRRSGTLLSGEDHDFCERAVAAGYRCEYRPECAYNTGSRRAHTPASTRALVLLVRGDAGHARPYALEGEPVHQQSHWCVTICDGC
jgi:cellulose synthase/poly-beta-1,6-N-acetylglucosamine synthase-like glycosyltransferase